MKIGTIFDQIDLGSMALPEFQRGYVWNRDQVRGRRSPSIENIPSGVCSCGLQRLKRQPRAVTEHCSPGP